MSENYNLIVITVTA